MKYLFFSLLTLVPAFSFAAGDSTAHDENSPLHVSIGLGLTNIDYGSFNNMAAQNNFPLLKDGTLFDINLGIFIKDKGWKWFGDLNVDFMLGNPRNTGAYDLQESSASGDINVDYAVFENKRHLFFPSLGIGWQSVTVNYNADLSGQTFGQAMADIAGERKFYANSNIYLNPRIAYNYKLGKAGNCTIGIRAGYRIGLNTPKWRVANKQKLAGAPKSSANGFYASVNFSF